MDSAQLHRIIEVLRAHGTDSAAVEVKSTARGLGSSVWDTVSAFANTSGGIIILGLDENTGFAPAKGFSPQKVVDQFISGSASSATQGGQFTNPPRFDIEQMLFEDAPIVLITIEANQPGNRPCYITRRGPQAGGFKRVGDADQRLTALEVYELSNDFIPQHSDRSSVSGTELADLNPKLVEALVAHARSQRAIAESDDLRTKLLRLNALTRTGEATLAGMLTLGAYPQQFFPRLIIDVTAHPGLEKSDPTASTRFIDRELCDGTIPEMIDSAVAAVRRNLRTHSIVTGRGREDRLEIPEEVIREAISNAVLHREYGPLFQHLDVSVDIFPDRVEVLSPGGLWGGVTVESIADGISRPRNPTLLNLLQSTPSSAGLFAAEGNGSGVRLMFNSMARSSLQAPEFTASAMLVKVVMRRHGAEIPEFRDWLDALSENERSQLEDAVLLTLKQNGPSTVSQLRARLGYDSADITTSLTRLKGSGIIRETDRGTYAIAEGTSLPSGSEAELLAHLSDKSARSIHEISELSGRTISALRKSLRSLIDTGWVTATAPPTSRNRKYLRAR